MVIEDDEIGCACVRNKVKREIPLEMLTRQTPLETSTTTPRTGLRLSVQINEPYRTGRGVLETAGRRARPARHRPGAPTQCAGDEDGT
jgi:hypothetical protein